MTPLALDHIALPITDARATVTFYRDILGLTLANAMSGEDWGEKPWLMLIFTLGDGREIALVERRGDGVRAEKRAPELPHFALAAPDHTALDAWKTKLAAAGVAISEESHGEQRSLYFDDPNGITLEITAPPSPLSSRPESSARVDAVVQAWLKEA
jgi:catechol 2,3-dioxygenase-like lactoylglutathione lyase family enzyme